MAVTGLACSGFAAILASPPCHRGKYLALLFQNVHCLFLLEVESDECYRFLCVNASFLKVTGLKETSGGQTNREVPAEDSGRGEAKYQKLFAL